MKYGYCDTDIIDEGGLEEYLSAFDKMFEGTTPKDLDKILPTKEYK